MPSPKHTIKRRTIARTAVVITAAVLLLTAAVGGVYAYITAQTPPLENQFDPVEVTCAVEESFDGQTKQDVAIRNTGDIAAYIRAAVVVTWADDDGNVWAQAPVEGTDYDVAWGSGDWAIGSDGFWYHRRAVAAGDTTADLIRTVSAVSAPKGYHLQVQVLATAIQASPDEAVEEAWNVTVSDGNVTPQ